MPAVSWLPAADSTADAAELEAWDSVGEAGLPGATCVSRGVKNGSEPAEDVADSVAGSKRRATACTATASGAPREPRHRVSAFASSACAQSLPHSPQSMQ